MAKKILTQQTADLDVIQALSDKPNINDGLTAAQVKAKFDEAANANKTYLNSTLIAELQASTAGASGAQAIGYDGSGVDNVADQLDAILSAGTGSIPPDGTVTEAKLATDAVTNTKVADNAIDTDNIVDGAVTNDKVASNAVNATNIVDGAVTNAKLGTGSVTEAKLGSGAVTEDKLETGAVTESKLGAGSVTNAKLASDVKIGSLASLDTTEKSSVVGSINETFALASYSAGEEYSELLAEQTINSLSYSDVLTLISTLNGDFIVDISFEIQRTGNFQALAQVVHESTTLFSFQLSNLAWAQSVYFPYRVFAKVSLSVGDTIKIQAKTGGSTSDDIKLKNLRIHTTEYLGS